MALPKLLKFAWRSKVSYNLTSAKRDTPRTANKKRKRISKIPTFIISGIAKMKVWNICYRLFAAFISLRTLAILNDRMIVVAAPRSILKPYRSIIPNQADMTIRKSKLFHPSLKYYLP